MKIPRLSLAAVFVLVALLSSSGFTALAFTGVTLSVPGKYAPTGHCSGTPIEIDYTVAHLTDDSGGYDYFGVLTFDGSGNIIDAYSYPVDAASSVPLSAFFLTFPGYDNLPDPVSRPFTTVVYDLPFYDHSGHSGSEIASYVQSNGSEVARTTFDPSFVPECAALPQVVTSTCPALPDGSVVGDLPMPTQAFYAPGKVSPGLMLNPGTYWVIGADESGGYYKILLSCQYLWVPVELDAAELSSAVERSAAPDAGGELIETPPQATTGVGFNFALTSPLNPLSIT